MRMVRNNKWINIIKVVFILAFCLAEFFLMSGDSPYSSILAIVAVCIGFFLDKNLPIALLMCISILKVSLNTTESIVVFAVVVTVALNEMRIRSIPTLRHYIWVASFFFISALFSTIGGLNPSLTAFFFFILNWICVFYIAFCISKGKYQLIFYALLLSGLTVLLQQTIKPLSFLEEGALLNSKDVATAIAVPVFLLVWTVINEKISILIKALFVVLATLGLITIISTYSRGVLIALFVTILYVFFTGVKNRSFLIIVVASVIVVAYLSLSDIVVDYDRLASNLEGGNGRTEIWEAFFRSIWNAGFLRTLFGCGPGGQVMLSVENTYAHSAILDYFFSFGLFGLAFIIYILVSVIVRLVRFKSRFYIGLYILNIFMFITHGNYVISMFLFLLGICLGAACDDSSFRKEMTFKL